MLRSPSVPWSNASLLCFAVVMRDIDVSKGDSIWLQPAVSGEAIWQCNSLWMLSAMCSYVQGRDRDTAFRLEHWTLSHFLTSASVPSSGWLKNRSSTWLTLLVSALEQNWNKVNEITWSAPLKITTQLAKRVAGNVRDFVQTLALGTSWWFIGSDLGNGYAALQSFSKLIVLCRN